MGRKVKPQALRNKDRVNLWEVPKLDTPYLVYIDPSNLCNLKCEFCPTGYTEFRNMRHNQLMDFDLFCSIVDQFKEFPNKIKHVTLCKDGEPLLNPRFVEMVQYLSDADIADKIILKTNGLLLNPPLNTKLTYSGLDQICISIKSVTDYEPITGVNVNIQNLHSNIVNLWQRAKGKVEVYISILDTGLTEQEKDKFYKLFQPYCDFIAIEDLHGWAQSGVKDFTLGQKATRTILSDKIACPLSLCSLAVNASGTVSVCGEDWAETTFIGDANIQSMQEIWDGLMLWFFRHMHLIGARHKLSAACDNCDYIRTLPDNIDKHLEELKGMI